MSTTRVDFLFRGAHPAFFWAASLLKQKGKSVAILPEPGAHSWELFPSEVLGMLGIEGLKTDRDQNPIQILTKKCRFGIFNDLDFTKKDFSFCTGDSPAPELNRGLSFYAKGSDYPAVFGENSSDLLIDAHRMEHFDLPAKIIQTKAIEHLKSIGVHFLTDDHNLPIAEQTIVLDISRAQVFRTRFEFTVPRKNLPVGATNRMLFVEKNSPLIELNYRDGILQFRTLLPEEPLLIEKILNTTRIYFGEEKIDSSQITITPIESCFREWADLKSHVDASKLGTWLISPAINQELGERTLYARISELLRMKFKKEQIFQNSELI